MRRRQNWWVIGLMVLLALTACSAPVIGVPGPRKEPGQQVTSGRKLLATYGCGSCHTIPGVPGADSKAGPPLNDFYQRSVIAGRLANTEDNLVQWIRDPQGVEPGNAMPDLGVTEQEARDMAAYLYHQPTLLDWLDR